MHPETIFLRKNSEKYDTILWKLKLGGYINSKCLYLRKKYIMCNAAMNMSYSVVELQ